jgi:2-polyprenyl-3-methyl-5-hydroxy-6-metoxy-1,4-benzoquinol methylase
MIEVSCNLCGQDAWRVLYRSTLAEDGSLDVSAFRCTSSGYGRHAQVVQCRRCGYVYANPRWTMEELLSAYGDVEDETYAEEREGRVLTFQRHLAHLEQFTGPGNGRRLLDVGAYIGVFVEVACNNGWNALGVEPSAWAVAEATRTNAPVFEGTMDHPRLQGEQFQVVTLWDVIEHVDDPRAELEKAYRLLYPGGWLVAHTMDIDSLAARLLGPRWPWLMSMHLHYFSQQTMAKMLQSVGFQVEWSGAMGRYLRLRYLSSRLGGMDSRLEQLFGSLIDWLGLGDVAVPVNFGDLFTVYARRPE